MERTELSVTAFIWSVVKEVSSVCSVGVIEGGGENDFEESTVDWNASCTPETMSLTKLAGIWLTCRAPVFFNFLTASLKSILNWIQVWAKIGFSSHSIRYFVNAPERLKAL